MFNFFQRLDEYLSYILGLPLVTYQITFSSFYFFNSHYKLSEQNQEIVRLFFFIFSSALKHLIKNSSGGSCLRFAMFTGNPNACGIRGCNEKWDGIICVFRGLINSSERTLFLEEERTFFVQFIQEFN